MSAELLLFLLPLLIYGGLMLFEVVYRIWHTCDRPGDPADYAFYRDPDMGAGRD